MASISTGIVWVKHAGLLYGVCTSLAWACMIAGIIIWTDQSSCSLYKIAALGYITLQFVDN